MTKVIQKILNDFPFLDANDNKIIQIINDNKKTDYQDTIKKIKTFIMEQINTQKDYSYIYKYLNHIYKTSKVNTASQVNLVIDFIQKYVIEFNKDMAKTLIKNNRILELMLKKYN